MKKMNEELNGQLSTAIEIFTNRHPKKFLHQLVSGQLDADRMDYLTRDSFFTGVAEGVIGYDRIIKMLTVFNGNLVVEEKAIYSIEKFLLSRRLMYWQVYLHKTVVAAEKMLVMIVRRAKELIATGKQVVAATVTLNKFLYAGSNTFTAALLSDFCKMDDHDVMATIKNWCEHEDKILSTLCTALIERKIMRIKLQAQPFDKEALIGERKKIALAMNITEDEAAYFVFWGEAQSTTYDPGAENIHILYKDGSLKDISQVDNALMAPQVNMRVKKYYICSLRLN